MTAGLTVHIPQNDDVSYSLYASGFRTAVPILTPDSSEWILTFRRGTAVVLFYSFESCRRVYIVTSCVDESSGSRYRLPGVEEDVSVIASFSGKKIMRFKKILKHLTKDDEYAPFRLPLLFWYRLGVFLQGKTFCFSDADNLSGMYI